MSRITRLAGAATLALMLAGPLAAPLTTSASAQTAISNAQILQGLTMTTNDEPTITAAILKQMAATAVKNNVPLPLDKSEIAKQLDKLAQITVQIQFALDSAIIRPESYATIGAIADALHHPILMGYRFLVVGNTDTTGSRAHNLELSQQRSDAITEALVNLYRVEPNRLESVGLGQEALQTPNDPTNPINRRVQIFNIGRE